MVPARATSRRHLLVSSSDAGVFGLVVRWPIGVHGPLLEGLLQPVACMVVLAYCERRKKADRNVKRLDTIQLRWAGTSGITRMSLNFLLNILVVTALTMAGLVQPVLTSTSKSMT